MSDAAVATASLSFSLLLVAAVVYATTRSASQGSMTRNAWMGIRTAATTASDEAWATAHAETLGWSRATAAVSVVFGVAVPAAALMGAGEPVIVGIGMTGMMLALAGTVAMGIVAHRAARHVRPAGGE